MRRLASSLSLVALLAAPIGAQSFNVSIGLAPAGLPPTNAYGAASGQTGFWNSISGIPTSIQLTDLAGMPTTVAIKSAGGIADGQFNHAGISGDDAALLEVYQDCGGPGTVIQWRVGGLNAGMYTVYTYSFSPDVPTTSSTRIDVLNSGLPSALVGNADWTGMHVEGVTYAKHTVMVTTGLLDVVVTTNSGRGSVNGLQIIEQGACGSPTSYCTAKTNSLGCIPAISGTGVPSASAGSGFTVGCTQVRNIKPGLLFYKVNGAQASLTFQCGTLCVGPSGIKRSPAQVAGGNPPPANDCSGTYSLDMNAFAVGALGGNPDPGLQVAGNTVQAQWWGRDQGFPAPCNTTLSDALEYTIGS